MKNKKPKLHLDWCSHKAAKYAVENFHYSKTLPIGKLVKIGVWEDGKFIGCVIYSRGATPQLPKKYGLTQETCCELTRVAISNHITPISKILSISFKLLRNISPNLELIVSFADTAQGHHGGIYQATNWIYDGKANKRKRYIYKKTNKQIHERTISAMVKSGKCKRSDFISEEMPDKHKYLMPLKNKEKYEILKKPYPKRIEHENNASTIQVEESGAVPTDALHSKRGVK